MIVECAVCREPVDTRFERHPYRMQLEDKTRWYCPRHCPVCHPQKDPRYVA